MRIEGEATYIDSTGKRHSIEGIGSLPDGSTLQSLKVSGIIKFDEMSCDDVQIEGDGRGKSITAKSMNVTGSVEVNTIEVENLKAKNIAMESRGGSIDEINCENVKIFHSDGFNSSGIFSKIFGSHKSNIKADSRVRINKITADKVELKNCEVDEIKCKDANIGSNCIIKTLFVEGECEIAADSKVVNVIHK